jgi:hypothetical protein
MSRNKRGGYSGSSSFDFEIERYKHVLTDRYLTEDEMCDETKNLDNQDDVENTYKYECITLEVKGNAYFTPGRTNCSNDDAYPDEGDIEIEEVIGPDGKDWSNILTDSEKDSIHEMLVEGAQEEPDYDGPDPDDHYYDDDYYDSRYDNYDPYPDD